MAFGTPGKTSTKLNRADTVSPEYVELLRVVRGYLQRFGPTDRLWRETAEAVTRVARAETPEETEQAKAQLVRLGATLAKANNRL